MPLHNVTIQHTEKQRPNTHKHTQSIPIYKWEFIYETLWICIDNYILSHGVPSINNNKINRKMKRIKKRMWISCCVYICFSVDIVITIIAWYGFLVSLFVVVVFFFFLVSFCGAVYFCLLPIAFVRCLSTHTPRKRERQKEREWELISLPKSCFVPARQHALVYMFDIWF